MSGSERAAIDFRLLGQLEALRNGAALPLGGPQQRALLAMLLVDAGRPVSADRLIEELWPGEPPSGAPTTLRSYVSRLRTALGKDVPIRAVAHGYVLEVAPETVDARRFERLLEEGHDALARGAVTRAVDRLGGALELWRGRALEGVGGNGALRLEAERLEDLRLRALELRIEAELQLGHASELVEELQQLVREHPFRERLWRHLMLALYRAGRQADALAAYRRARELLDEELGLEPSEELRQLEAAILRHEVAEARPPEEPHNLPAPITSFVGREAELDDIERLLGDARLVTLTGVGGVGKTRLAVEVGRRSLSYFPGGIFFVDLSSLADPALVPSQVARAVELREQPGRSSEQLLAERLRETETLLVLDNCEHVRSASAELAQTLLAACARLRIVATSRERLGTPGEHDYPLQPLSLVSPDSGTEAIRASEAVRLFVARARESRPRLTDDDATFLDAARIVYDLDGLPLAIELAAARAKALSLDDIARRIEDRFRFLVSWRRLTTARHRTLREAIDWSYELLSGNERALLARVSVFAGGFTLGAAAAVCLDGDEEQALQLVERLVDASLVVAEERRGRMRYRPLETVRQYAAERLDELGETDRARRSHARHFGDVAESLYEACAEPHAQLVYVEWADAERDNLRAASRYAEELTDGDAELRIGANLWYAWWIRGSLGEGRARIERALDHGRDGPAVLVARALVGAGGLASAQGDYESARDLATEALDIATAANARADEVAARIVIGVSALAERDFETAREHFEQALALGESLGHATSVSASKLNLGLVALGTGETEQAISILEELLEENPAFASLNLGVVRYRVGDYEAARENWEHARSAFTELGFRAHVGHALQGLAAVETRIGDPAEAARLLGRAHGLLADVGASADDFDPTLEAEADTEARAALGEEAFRAAYEEGVQAQEIATPQA